MQRSIRLETKLAALHQKARHAAFMHYICKGFIPPHLTDIVNATSTLAAFLKYNPDQPRVPAGNADGGQWTSGDGGDSPFIDAPVNDPPIQPVYPIEDALTLFFGGEGLLAAGEASAVAEGADAVAATDVETVSSRLEDLLAPDGELLGNPGTDSTIRELPGGTDAAQKLFDDLTEGGTLSPKPSYEGTAYTMPDGSFIGYRPSSNSGPPTIDVNIPSFGNTLRKLNHYRPEVGRFNRPDDCQCN